jgi:hypothetical protein
MSHLLNSVESMELQDARRIREAFEEVLAAIDRAAPHLTHEELVSVGDQLGVVGRMLTPFATASPVETTPPGDDGPDRLSHPLRRVDG